MIRPSKLRLGNFRLHDPQTSAFAIFATSDPPKNIESKKNSNQPQLLKRLTIEIIQSYQKCSPSFRYTSVLNPRRALTKPSEPVGNDGYDNENSDYILYVNDVVGYTGHQYQILDMLGQGTFGQVAKGVNINTKEYVAIKVIKNKPAYFNQGLVEIQIIEMLNHQYDTDNSHHIVRLVDYFVFRNHLCLVLELLSLNLFELIKQNNYKGLSMTLIRCFMNPLLDALSVMQTAHVIHCDLKPENILLENLTSPSIKVIDFGSACFENNTVYSYIQSRFYRSPEVLVGVPYDSAIDMWSLGCIGAELFLGLPLFPGNSEHNQIFRIEDMLGEIPDSVLDKGDKTQKYFNKERKGNKFTHSLKSEKQFAEENKTPILPSKKYFKYKTLPEIIERYQIKDGLTPVEIEREQQNRKVFTHFLLGLLNLDPQQRWDPEQAKLHPFITGEHFVGEFHPPPKRTRPKTAPRAIPWGIQNVRLTQKPISTSYPDLPDTFAFTPSSFTPSSFNPHDYFYQPSHSMSSYGHMGGSPQHFPGASYMEAHYRMQPPMQPPLQPQMGMHPSQGHHPNAMPMMSPHYPPENFGPFMNSPRQYQPPYQPMYPPQFSISNYGTPPNSQSHLPKRQRSKSDISPHPKGKLPLPLRGQKSPREGGGYGNKTSKKYSSWGHDRDRKRSNSSSRHKNTNGGNRPRRQNSTEQPPPLDLDIPGIHIDERDRSSSSSTSSPIPDWEEELLFEIDGDSSSEKDITPAMSNLSVSKNRSSSQSHNRDHNRRRAHSGGNNPKDSRSPRGNGGNGQPKFVYQKKQPKTRE